jgi:steroid delta-isomerase-like uncharacterized protein
MPAAENKKSVERMLEAFNSGDFKIVDDLLAHDFGDETPFPGTTKAHEGLKKQISHLRQAFPDVKFSIENMVAEGETVAFRWKMIGTQEKTFIGHAPSRKKVTHFGNDFVVFHNGKMVSHRSSDNLRDLLSALGHEPVFKVEADPDLKKPLK